MDLRIRSCVGAIDGGQPHTVMENIFITLNYRSPIGALGGFLSRVDPVDLAVMLLDNLSKVDDLFDIEDIDHYLLGNAVDSNFGANLLNRIVHRSILPNDVHRTRIKQAALTGLKLVGTAIELLDSDTHVVMCQAVENMSSIPDYIPNRRLRHGQSIEHVAMVNGMLRDAYYVGEPYSVAAMISDQLVAASGLTRKDMDAFTWQSIHRYRSAASRHHYRREIAPINLPANPGQARWLETDQSAGRYLDLEKVGQANAVFEHLLTDASIAGAGDGSALMVIADRRGLQKTGLLPQARVLAYDEAYCSPSDYISCAVSSIERALTRATVTVDEIGIWEIHEDTAYTPLALAERLGITTDKINQCGGSLAMANPISVTGLRLVMSACNQLSRSDSQYALAHISDVAGSSATIVLERAH